MSQKVTEEEARKKWCRHGFMFAHREGNHHGMAGAAVNRSSRSDPDDALCRCLGSGCMDWAWFNEPDEGEKRLGYCDVQRGF